MKCVDELLKKSDQKSFIFSHRKIILKKEVDENLQDLIKKEYVEDGQKTNYNVNDDNEKQFSEFNKEFDDLIIFKF